MGDKDKQGQLGSRSQVGEPCRAQDPVETTGMPEVLDPFTSRFAMWTPCRVEHSAEW